MSLEAGFEIQNLEPLTVCSLFVFLVQDVSSRIPDLEDRPSAYYPTVPTIMNLTLWILKSK